MLKQIGVLLFICLKLSLYATDEEPNYIEFGAISLSQKSNITPMNLKENLTISSFNETETTQNEINPYISFQYKYKYNNLSYLTTLDYDQKFSLDIYNDSYGTKIFTKPYFEYKNPYKLNSKRETTYVQDIGIGEYYTLKSNEDSKFDIAYYLSNKELSNDTLAQETPSLKRDGNTHRIEFSTEYEFFKINSGLFITENMGNAENHKGIDLKLSTAYNFENNFQVGGEIGLKHTIYEDINPIFDITNKLDDTKISLYTEYDFPQSNYYLTTGVSLNKQYSNIPFFNESNKNFSFAVGKNFKTY